jgi:hypothetical protein
VPGQMITGRRASRPAGGCLDGGRARTLQRASQP